jgi:hypothetical protein
MRPAWCPGCRAAGVMRPPTRRPVGQTIAAAARPLTAEEIVRASWDLQRCPATGLPWSAPTMVLCWGAAGSGKSTLAYQIAAQCSPVTIASLEESPGPPMARRLTMAGMNTRRDVQVLVKPGLHEILNAARHGHAVVIDSISVSTFQPGDLRGLMDAGCPLLIGVLHATKGGDYRGPTSFVHECDIVLRVEDGAWTTEKNRFGASGVGGGIRGISTAEAGAAAAPPDHFATAQEPE